MRRIVKKTVCVLTAGILAAGLLAGCGSSGTTAAVNDQTDSSVMTTAKADHKAEATLISFAGKTLKVKIEDKEYTLDISKAIINTNVMHSGDTLIIYYDGELSEDPDKFTVISVENLNTEKEESAEIVGTLEEITMNSVTIRTNDGRVITFNVNNAEHSFSYGVSEGNWVTVIYDGELNGTDTTNLAVTKVHDAETEHTLKVKAQTTIEDVNDTVYAMENYYVRSSFMMASEVVGELKPGEKIQRTGHCNNGWDRIIYNGKEAYVYGKILTTNPNEVGMKGTLTSLSQKVNIKSLSETVYAKTDANVRQNYSTASESIGALKAGSSVTRTGICDNGWSRIDYFGRDAYVYSDILTTKNPNAVVDGVTITAVNETIFAVTDANVRESFTVDSKAVGALKYGEHVVRTGICSNGWSRIIYNNRDAYVNSDLISKTNPVKIVAVKIYVTRGRAYATTDANIRESFSSDTKAIGLLKQGEGIDVTGVTDNNWTRVSFNGQVGYIHNDLLTSTPPAELKTPTAAPAEPTKAPAKPTKAPAKPTKAPAKPTKAPAEPTKAPAKPTKAPAEPTKAPAEPTTEPVITEEPMPQPVDDSSADSQTEPADESSADSETEPVDDSSADSETEPADESFADSKTEPVSDDSSKAENVPSDQSAADQAKEDNKDTDQITGTVVGYDISTVTIQVDDEESDGERPVAEEPKAEKTEEEEYPSLTYEEAEGEEDTFYTFDITDASQSYSNGINEGNEVTVSYTGDLDNMETVQATNVSDSNEESSATESVIRGNVVSTTANTVTIRTDDGVTQTFSYDGIEELDLKEEDRIKVTANMNQASNDQNVIKATAIEK